MAAFHETRFPDEISYGSKGGPRRLTQVVSLKSGFEERNQSWQHSRRKYDASIGIRRLSHLHSVLDFWEARRGRLYGFRWKDWLDFKSASGRADPSDTDQVLDVGDGTETEFQLVKRYSDAGEEYVRPIKKPVIGTTVVALDGVSQPSGWTLDSTTGVITFAVAPGSGVVITAGFEFDVPVRFDDDELQLSADAFESGSIPAINVIEIRV
ncbi:glycoside hydrolase family protein [Paracoccus phage vB_PmaS-R3]|uniref:Glycoside hydrolase family protein n=1 Tax=Paracoccus phage vB_PmaS-R3 TaxID=2494563 RepID=A0A0B5A2K3_9CAUD|nr:glycoside hydrolase [Paracoccus phage vB_PmaS-R3]AJD83173.1 glycoside hydrolase family protein [Paracoccus phage vB_PmaS-R3]